MQFRYDETDLTKIIKKIILKNLGVDNVEIDNKFSEDIKMDDPTKIEILLAIEHAIGINVEQEKLNKVNSIDDALNLYRFVYEELKKKSGRNVNFVPFGNQMKC